MSNLVVKSPADMVNMGLRRIGYKLRVGSLYDGSNAAKVALDIYSQTRDELFAASDYGFCERNVNLTLLKSAPANGYFPPNNWNPATNPPPPWLFEYTYPADCLKVRAVKPQPTFVLDPDPQPWVFAVENDVGYDPPAKVILCNVANALLVYTGQVTDPLDWEPGFVEEFAAALAERLAPQLANLDAAKLEAADEQQEHQKSMQERG